jgi:uncharacterized protein with HEPN domain
MRRDDVSLREMLAAAEQLLELLKRPDAERLLQEDRSFRHSVLFEFVIIGEEVAALSEALCSRHPEVPWRRISGFRNRIAHGYFELSLPIVWQLWHDEIPTLRAQLLSILAAEFPKAPDGSQDAGVPS